MGQKSKSVGSKKTRREIVKLLKTEGEMDSAQLAERLGLTAMGVRQHLYALQEQKLVGYDERATGVGRPTKFWSLTPEANRLFPDAYAELSVSLLDALGDAFGAAGLQRVLESRSQRQLAAYRARISRSMSLKEKLQRLAQLRTEEGYMAEVQSTGKDQYLLVENHCPICAAATACRGFCDTELDVFRSVLGPQVHIERVEHIIAGNRRCAYRITPKRVR